MARTDAVFGGEHSAHYYFRDFWRADTGMLAAMHVLAALGEQPGTLAELCADYERYAASGEINSTVADQAGRAPKRCGRRSPDADRHRHSGRADPRTGRRGLAQRPGLQHRAAAAAERGGRHVEPMAEVRDEALAVIRAERHPTGVSDHAYRPDLLAILACPSADHAPLRLEPKDGGVEELVCTYCASRFPIPDGIPVLLADEATPGPNGLGDPAADGGAGRVSSMSFDEAVSTTPSAGCGATAAACCGRWPPPARRSGGRVGGHRRVRGRPAARSELPPRSVLVAPDASAPYLSSLMGRLASLRRPGAGLGGEDLPPNWAGPADVLLVASARRSAPAAGRAGRPGRPARAGAGGGRSGRLAGGRRGRPAPGRRPRLPPAAARRALWWALATPALQAPGALGRSGIPRELLDAGRRRLDEVAEAGRPAGSRSPTRPRCWPLELAESIPVIAGIGPLASVAARRIADALQLIAGSPADGRGAAGRGRPDRLAAGDSPASTTGLLRRPGRRRRRSGPGWC